MSIRFKLILSYIAMLIIPIILTILVGAVSLLFYFGEPDEGINRKYGIGLIRSSVMERDNIFSDIKGKILKSPEKFQDEDYLKTLEEKLTKASSGIIIRRDDKIIYSSKGFEGFNQGKSLPEFGSYIQDMVLPNGEEKRGFVLSQHDFYFKDSSNGSVFLITNLNPIKSAYIKTRITLSIFIVIILVLTNGLLTYIVARSIVNPLERLKSSANRIKEGDLDFKVKADTKDEIGELCSTFEEMRARLKESLETQLQYEKNRRELVSNISHDLKTPITAIKGYVEGIRDGVADNPEKLKRYIDTIHSKTEDVDRLINELFLYSKLDLNKFPFNYSIINIKSYLLDLTDEIRFDLREKNIELNYKEDIEGNIVVSADSQQLKRVFMNIVDNGVKYMDKEHGAIDIFARDKGDIIEVEIRDNGQGIPDKSLEFIFDRFYRADESRNTLIGGSGLGLSIARKIIEEHGGTMWAESEEGTGTSIFFTLKKYKSGEKL